MLIIENPPVAAAPQPQRFTPIGPIVIERTEFSYRTVPVSRGAHVRGFHPVKPGHGDVAYEGLLERFTLDTLIQFPGLSRVISQPFTTWYRAKGQYRRYTPDFQVEFDEVPFELECLGFEKITLIECKPSKFVKAQRDDIERNFRAVAQLTSTPIIMINEEDLLAMEIHHE